jgi:uncharacterized protein (DUF1330 family)
MSSHPTYMLAQLNINDREYFEREYKSRVIPVLDKYRVKVLAVADHPTILEGDSTVNQVVLLQFENAEHSRSFYTSDEYQQVIQYRFDSASSNLCTFSGLKAAYKSSGT